MKQYTELELLKMGKAKRAGHKFTSFFASIPGKLKNLGIKIGKFSKNLGIGIWHWIRDLGLTFVHGDWKTKVSYFIMGFGNVTRKQILRGLLFFAFEVIFIVSSLSNSYASITSVSFPVSLSDTTQNCLIFARLKAYFLLSNTTYLPSIFLFNFLYIIFIVKECHHIQIC